MKITTDYDHVAKFYDGLLFFVEWFVSRNVPYEMSMDTTTPKSTILEYYNVVRIVVLINQQSWLFQDLR